MPRIARAALVMTVFALPLFGCEKNKCKDLAASFENTLQKRDMSCDYNEDCSCGPARLHSAKRVADGWDCGNAANLATVTQLRSIAGEFNDPKNECERNFACAPQECVPECRDGRCVNAALVPAVVEEPDRALSDPDFAPVADDSFQAEE